MSDLQTKLAKIQERAEASAESVTDFPDSNTQSELDQLSVEASKAELADFKQDSKMREKYANRLYTLSTIWIGFIIAVTLFQGTGLKLLPEAVMPFRLSDQVVISLVVTTTASVLGTLIIVIKYLFPPR